MARVSEDVGCPAFSPAEVDEMVPEPDEEEDDWTQYADAGYASSYDPWSDMVEADAETDTEAQTDDEFDDFDEEELRPRDIPRCPAPAGIAHAIRLGTCDACLGRVAGVRIAGTPLPEVGAGVRAEALARDADISHDEGVECCPFCEDLFVEIDLISSRFAEAISGIEFSKAQLGLHFSKEHVAAEEVLRSSIAATGCRPLKATLSDAVQSAVSERVPGIVWVKERPEVMLLLDTLTLGVNADVRAFFLYGRYRKLARGIPQTRWPCRACRGNGCDSCKGTGQQYPASIQSLVCEPMVAAFDAKSDAFHGMGREDIDVRCLGQGRPFVAEMKRPMRRTTDLAALAESINAAADGQIEIHALRPSNRAEVARIKETKAEKSYTIRFACEHAFSDEEAAARIGTLAGKVLEQQTPQRVAHRRADKVRKRKVISIDDISFHPGEIEFLVRCESGTYVKELVHSDEGRTNPSIAGVLEADCEVVSLDVEDIHAD
jgi:tRNA pseudouridine synthase 10